MPGLRAEFLTAKFSFQCREANSGFSVKSAGLGFLREGTVFRQIKSRGIGVVLTRSSFREF